MIAGWLERWFDRGELRRRLVALILGQALLVLALFSGLALLALSGHFILASGLAGLGLIGMINIFTPGAAIRLAALTRTVARYGERLITHATTLDLLTALRMKVFGRLLERPELELEGLRRGDALSRLTADVDTLDHLYLGVAQPALGVLSISLLVATVLWMTAPELLGLALLPAVGLLGLALIVAYRGARRLSRRQGLDYPALRGLVTQGLEARLELRALGLMDDFVERIDARSRALIGRGVELARVDAIAQGLGQLAGLSAVWLALCFGLSTLGSGELAGPMLGAIVLGLFGLAEAWLQLPGAFRRLGQSLVAADRVQGLAPEPAKDSEPGSLAWPARPSIELRSIRFAWAPHQPPVFSDLDLELQAGERLALVGPSGLGKTTLARLILGQVRPQRGNVRIGGLDVHAFDESLRHRKMAYLPQTPVLFSDSLAGNLRLARPDASDAALHQALCSAGLGDFLDALPRGLDTWLDEGASNLSGGEARRIAVARLLLTEPEIVILDEPLASLDRDSMERLRLGLEAWLHGRTCLIISHQSECLPSVDRVVDLAELAVSA